jgi:hypothetical protein
LAYDEAGESAFVSLMTQGVEEFQPEWVQTFPRGTSMAADQERAWAAWLVYFEQDVTNRADYAQAYVNATLNYVRTGQLGNGVWGGVSAAAHQQPDLGGGWGTPVVPADQHRLRPLARAWGDTTLAAEGIVTPAMKDDLLAYFTTTWHLNALHFGHYLEYLNESSDQLGYMTSPAYPDPFDVDPTVKAGQEFRALSAGPGMLAWLEPELDNQRPSASISPAHFGVTSSGAISGQSFTISDPDGWADLVIIQIVMTELQGGSVTDEQTWYVGYTSDLTPQITSSTSVTATWSNPPTLASGHDYRFVITTLDGDYRWDMDTALYEIP